MFKSESSDLGSYESWSVDPTVWIEAAKLCETERDHPFELNFLNHALRLHENATKKKSMKFPYHKLAYACYRVGNEDIHEYMPLLLLLFIYIQKICMLYYSLVVVCVSKKM